MISGLKLLSNTFPTLLLDLALLLDPSAGLGTFEELLDFGVTLDEDFTELLLDLVLELDFAELLLDLVLLLVPSAGLGTFEELLDFGVTLEEDFAELRLDEDSSSQSSHTLEDEPSEGRVAKSLSSSPQAIKSRANKKSSKEFFIVVNITLF